MRRGLSPIYYLLLSSFLLAGLGYAAPLAGRLAGEARGALALTEAGVTVVWVGLVVLITRGIAGLRFGFGASLAGLAASAAVLAASSIVRGGIEPLHSIALIYAASFLGCVVAVIFREPNILLPVALLAPAVDYWTVSFGPVRQVIEGSPQVLQHVSAAMPTAHAVQPILLIGAGDFLFMAMFLSAAERLKMSPSRTAWWFFALVTLTMLLIVSGRGLEDGLPGLVAIALGFVIANRRHFRLSKSEIAITAGFAAAIGLAVLAVSMSARR